MIENHSLLTHPLGFLWVDAWRTKGEGMRVELRLGVPCVHSELLNGFSQAWLILPRKVKRDISISESPYLFLSKRSLWSWWPLGFPAWLLPEEGAPIKECFRPRLPWGTACRRVFWKAAPHSGEKGCHAAVMQGHSVWLSKHWKGVLTLSQLPEAFGINEQLAPSKPAEGKNLLLQEGRALVILGLLSLFWNPTPIFFLLIQSIHFHCKIKFK